ncbi:MAG: hypothetical protein RIA63_07420 [Cyclobacteriaceae bacterium]
MNQLHINKAMLSLSLALAVLLASVSYVGLSTPNFYALESFNWQIQSVGQDFIDLVVVFPILVISSFLAYKKRDIFVFVWLGTMVYLVYTFLIYCFAVHFNSLFIFYCLILGLIFYSISYFIYVQSRQGIRVTLEKMSIIRTIGYYFLFISVSFYLLWIAEIIPSVILNTTPKSLSDTGLLTNPVHVLDLSIVLPGIFIAGITLLGRKRIGFFLAPVVLTFFILMDVTIGTLNVVMKQEGLSDSFALTGVMGALALFSLWLLIQYSKSMRLA